MVNEKMLEEYRDMAKDDSVPMKHKVGMNAALTIDTLEAVEALKASVDQYVKSNAERFALQDVKIAQIEVVQKDHTEEIDKLRTISNRNDIFVSIAAFINMILAGFGLKN